MKNIKFKKTLGLFIWTFIILLLFNVVFTWINFYQFKTAAEKHQNEMSNTIALDVKNRYESLSNFLLTMDPFISETIKKSLYSIEREIEENGKNVNNEILESLRKQYNLTNIYVLDNNGIVQYSTDKREIGKYSREFHNQEDKERWENAFKRIVQTKEIYIEDSFYRSEIYPHRYHKWGYKGIGYIEDLGLVVLEVGIQVLDIKDKSISPLVTQIADLEKINNNIVSIEFVNLPPNELNKDYKNEQYKTDNNEIITKLTAKGLDGADIQLIITTYFSETEANLTNAFENALIWTIFYIVFSFLLCLLLYYRFSIPTQYIKNNVIDDAINKLNELKK